MNPRTGPGLLAIAVCLGGLSGCVDRRFVITTDPPGAIVYDEKNLPVGASPADHQFTYYGKYRFVLVRDGYETMTVVESVKAPWYEFIGVDFFSENVIPWTIRDVRRFHYVMQPKQMVPPEDVLTNGLQMQLRGRALGGGGKLPAEPAPVEAPPPRVLPPPGTPPSPGPGPAPNGPASNQPPMPPINLPPPAPPPSSGPAPSPHGMLGPLPGDRNILGS